MHFFCWMVAALLLFSNDTFGKKNAKEFYQVKIYQLKSQEQVMRVDSFLRDAWLPALHRYGIAKIGVFKPIANDTAAVKKLYVLVPFKSLDQFHKLASWLEKDAGYQSASLSFREAPFNNAAFVRTESILLEAFDKQPAYEMPALQAAVTEKVYELRSYESATDKLYAAKVDMFNAGGETALFKRLGFNAIFYASVISGSQMPNLMYMTSFESLEQRNAHWKTFGSDPEWKTLSAKPEYKNTVSRSEIILMHATEYSDF
ncbi:MAG: NIPSNAP family protein [Bacteroidota bacterium]